MLKHLDSEDKREQYKTDYENLSHEIAAEIDIPFETQFTGGKLTSGTKESIASLLTLDQVVSPLRVHSVNTLLSRFLGVLELSDVNALEYFPEDKINFNKQFWGNLLKIS